jgi:hypothetical protein
MIKIIYFIEIFNKMIGKPSHQCYVIDIQKGGLMALVKYLNKHPDIIYVKSECQFFIFLLRIWS